LHVPGALIVHGEHYFRGEMLREIGKRASGNPLLFEQGYNRLSDRDENTKYGYIHGAQIVGALTVEQLSRTLPTVTINDVVDQFLKTPATDVVIDPELGKELSRQKTLCHALRTFDSTARLFAEALEMTYYCRSGIAAYNPSARKAAALGFALTAVEIDDAIGSILKTR
jgi:hypothetical protein